MRKMKQDIKDAFVAISVIVICVVFAIGLAELQTKSSRAQTLEARIEHE
jgi:hypothetical protein